MQCKDIDTIKILKFMSKNPDINHTWFILEMRRRFPDLVSIRPCFPDNCPDNLVLAKMKNLVKRGLVDGCACGCRGDFKITQKGIDLLK